MPLMGRLSLLRRLLLSLLACARVQQVHGWTTLTQQRFGTTIEIIHNESLGYTTHISPQQSLGLLWMLPQYPDDQTGLGGTITWAWDAQLCEYLLPSVNEQFWMFSLVSCESLRASAHRAFDTWAMNSHSIKFTDVSAQCDAAGLRAAECPHAEIALTVPIPPNATAGEEGSNSEQNPIVSSPQEMLSVGFSYTNGLRPVRSFGQPGTAYFYEVSRQVPSVVGGAIRFAAEDVCWYTDSQFCRPMHDWKQLWRSSEAAYVVGVTIFFAIWGFAVLGFGHMFCFSVKRATRVRNELLRDGGDDGEDDDPVKARAEATLSVIESMPLRDVTMHLFLIIVPWPYFLAIFDTCWHCFDFEAATAHEIGHLLGLGNPDDVAALNSYHAGLANGSVIMGEHSCRGDLWGDVSLGVPPGAFVNSITGVRPTIMSTFTAHDPYTCLQPDDLEALTVLYPSCEGAPTTPVCAKAALNLGWLRLIIFSAGPVVVSFFVAIALQMAATVYLDKRRLAAATASKDAAKDAPS